MNGPLKFLTARKILPLLDLLAKFKRVLACSWSPNFCVARKLAKQIFILLVLAKKSQCSACSRMLAKTIRYPFLWIYDLLGLWVSMVLNIYLPTGFIKFLPNCLQLAEGGPLLYISFRYDH